MPDEKKLKPMSDFTFKGMVWLYKFYDFFGGLKRDLKKIPLREGMTVVDYGCGPGRYTLPIAKLVGTEGKVFAVDIHPLAISSVKKKAENEGLTNVETILVNSYNTGIQGASVDLVLFIDALHIIEDRNALLSEIHRLMKPDGILFMDSGHMRMSRAREIVESTGFLTIVECQGRSMLVAPKAKQRTPKRGD